VFLPYDRDQVSHPYKKGGNYNWIFQLT
jgi:hypothetical protein